MKSDALEEFNKLCTPEEQIKQKKSPTEKKKAPVQVTIEEVMQSRYIGKRIKVRGTLTEKDRTSYVAKIESEMNCQPSKCATCDACPNANEAYKNVKFDVYSEEILNFISSNNKEIKTMLREAAGIPSGCRKHQFSRYSVNANLYQAGMVPCIEASGVNVSSAETSSDTHSIWVGIVLFGDLDVKENGNYDFVGVPLVDPKTQRQILLVEEVTPVASDMDNFVLNDDRKAILKRFQTEDTVQAIHDKTEDVLKELRVNVHGVYGYHMMEYFTRLTFNSVLGFMFQGVPHHRGWLDGAIIGDSRTGKSKIGESLMAHYQFGHKVTAENSTHAGLLGGLSPSNIKGSQHQLKWGIFPRLDRGIIFLDEVHVSAAKKMWGKLNDVRASGVARITKVGTPERSAKARLRKLWGGNPPDGRSTRDYYYPVKMLEDIFPAPETIARLDFFVCPRSDDSKITEMNDQEKIAQYYCGTADRLLIRFIASRTTEQVKFTPEAEEYLIRMGVDMSALCDGVAIPLLQANEARFTLGRGAAAVAAGRYSVDETGEVIIVHKADAVYYVQKLTENYQHESTRYFEYSRELVKTVKFEGSEEFYTVACKVKQAFSEDPGMVKQILESSMTTFKMIVDTTDMEIHKVRTLFKVLCHNDLVAAKATNSSFRKTRRGIATLRYLMGVMDQPIIQRKHCDEFFNSYVE